jgi:hypothetical protein
VDVAALRAELARMEAQLAEATEVSPLAPLTGAAATECQA